jgi:hypothetical protein
MGSVTGLKRNSHYNAPKLLGGGHYNPSTAKFICHWLLLQLCLFVAPVARQTGPAVPECSSG